MAHGCNTLNPIEPGASSPAPEPIPPKKTPRGSVEERVLAYISKLDAPIWPRQVAFETGLNHESVKTACRRLGKKHLLELTPVGYEILRQSFEKDVEKQLRFDGEKAALPKVHDVHMTFKPENVRKALARPELWQPRVHVTYELEGGRRGSDRGPAGSDLRPNAGSSARSRTLTRDREPAEAGNRKAFNRGCQPIASLSSPRFHLDRFFDPKDPDSIFRKWRHHGGSLQEIKGGYQERLDFRTHKLLLQFYRTGTIKVIISNSECPFDVNQWRQALNAIDGLFLSKTGICFWDISNFFHIEKIHLNNDIRIEDRPIDLEFSGTSRLNCTIKQFDDWLYRVYEKVLGDELVLRSESCLEKGNFDDHQLNSMLALLQGGVTPTHVVASLFKLTKDDKDRDQVLRRQQNEIHEIGKQVESLKGMFSKLMEWLGRKEGRASEEGGHEDGIE